MKKLSLLIALCMLLTISGVFAAWTYTTTTIGKVEDNLDIGVADPELLGNAGTINIVSNTVEVLIDQKDVGNYDAVLTVTGSIVLTFTANTGSPDGIVDYIVADLILTDIPKYNGDPIYVVENEGRLVLDWGTPVDGVYTATITADMIKNVLKLGADINLPTYPDYLEFVELERPTVITLAVSSTFSVAPASN